MGLCVQRRQVEEPILSNGGAELPPSFLRSVLERSSSPRGHGYTVTTGSVGGCGLHGHNAARIGALPCLLPKPQQLQQLFLSVVLGTVPSAPCGLDREVVTRQGRVLLRQGQHDHVEPAFGQGGPSPLASVLVDRQADVLL